MWCTLCRRVPYPWRHLPHQFQEDLPVHRPFAYHATRRIILYAWCVQAVHTCLSMDNAFRHPVAMARLILEKPVMTAIELILTDATNLVCLFKMDSRVIKSAQRLLWQACSTLSNTLYIQFTNSFTQIEMWSKITSSQLNSMFSLVVARFSSVTGYAVSYNVSFEQSTLIEFSSARLLQSTSTWSTFNAALYKNLLMKVTYSLPSASTTDQSSV